MRGDKNKTLFMDEEMTLDRLQAHLGVKNGNTRLSPAGERPDWSQTPAEILLDLLQCKYLSSTISRVGTQDPDELNLFAKLGLVLAANLEVIGLTSDQLRVRTGSEIYLLSLTLAHKLWMEKEVQS